MDDTPRFEQDLRVELLKSERIRVLAMVAVLALALPYISVVRFVLPPEFNPLIALLGDYRPISPLLAAVFVFLV